MRFMLKTTTLPYFLMDDYRGSLLLIVLFLSKRFCHIYIHIINFFLLLFLLHIAVRLGYAGYTKDDYNN